MWEEFNKKGHNDNEKDANFINIFYSFIREVINITEIILGIFSLPLFIVILIFLINSLFLFIKLIFGDISILETASTILSSALEYIIGIYMQIIKLIINFYSFLINNGYIFLYIITIPVLALTTGFFYFLIKKSSIKFKFMLLYIPHIIFLTILIPLLPLAIILIVKNIGWNSKLSSSYSGEGGGNGSGGIGSDSDGDGNGGGNGG